MDSKGIELRFRSSQAVGAASDRTSESKELLPPVFQRGCGSKVPIAELAANPDRNFKSADPSTSKRQFMSSDAPLKGFAPKWKTVGSGHVEPSFSPSKSGRSANGPRGRKTPMDFQCRLILRGFTLFPARPLAAWVRPAGGRRQGENRPSPENHAGGAPRATSLQLVNTGTAGSTVTTNEVIGDEQVRRSKLAGQLWIERVGHNGQILNWRAPTAKQIEEWIGK
jgi:hypothetical protein